MTHLKFILAVLLIGYLPCLLVVVRYMGRPTLAEDLQQALILALLLLLPAYGIRLLVGL